MQTKIKTWVQLIQVEKFQDALKDIQRNTCTQVDSKVNKSIFKVLLHLCCAVDKAKKSNRQSGQTVAELTKLLCSLLAEVPDNNNFVKCLFTIVRFLISLNLYKDAGEICCYLQPGKLYNPQNGTLDLLTKVESLWHALVSNMCSALATEASNSEAYANLKSALKEEVKMTQMIHKNYTKHLIVNISRHMERIAIADAGAKPHLDFYKLFFKHLTETKLCLDKDEKYAIYSHALRIVGISHRTIDANNNSEVLVRLSGCIEGLLAEDEECYECFQQFQSLCTALAVPMHQQHLCVCSTSDVAEKLKDIVHRNSIIAQKYRGTEGLRCNALALAEIIEPIFIHWEKCLETDRSMADQLLDSGLLLEMMNLLLQVNADESYSKQEPINCRWCTGKVCAVRRDLYNVIIVTCKFINLVCKFSSKEWPREVFVLAREILEHNVRSVISEMRGCECVRWTQLWNSCRTLIYNIGLVSAYEESVRLFSLLCVCFFQVQAIKSEKDQGDSISYVLYKLSVVYINNNMHRKAMTVAALYALLTYNEPKTKAFLVWTTIKKRATEETAKLTMLECLRRDRNEIESELGFTGDISEYDLVELCSREATSLIEKNVPFANGVSSTLDELKKLKPSNYQYARVLHLLGYYLLAFHYDNSVLKYYEQAVSKLKLNKTGCTCLRATLKFFTFVEELDAMNKQTHKEMENTKFALHAPKMPELSETKSPNVVPAYAMINVKKDSELMLKLRKCLEKWRQLLECDIDEVVKNWQPSLILNMLITAGEYSRLYRYEDCEADIWMLAYKLASKVDDYSAIIYLTGRCISLRRLNHDWIDIAKEYAAKYRDSKEKHVIHAIAIFWLSLADFYFECGRCDDAKQLLTDATSLRGISFQDNTSVYLLSLDIIIRNSNSLEINMEQEEYGAYIVKSVFAMRNLNQDLLLKKCEDQAERLFGCDVLFTATVNLSTRVNSLLSFRGISPGLVQRLKTAQSLGAVMRVAELLKSLCYIDLSRSQLSDCEVKLEGLEHLLDIETFQSSIKAAPVEAPSAIIAVTPTKIIDPVRDMSQLDTSPVLTRKVFDLPKFISHVNCDCYKCTNVSYKYSVFAATYIRAQLYALQNHDAMAVNHFRGAFEIRQNLFGQEESAPRPGIARDRDAETDARRFSLQARFYITDYVQLLIDFCYFLKAKSTRQREVLDLVNVAINTCHEYRLEGHPAYVSARELALDIDFQSLLDSPDRLHYMVTQPHDIDVSNYMEAPVTPSICVTPSAKPCVKKGSVVRRKRSPLALKITKINIDWSDSDSED